MPHFSLSSLRSRAIALVLLAIVPVLALTLYSYVEQRHRAVREVQRDELVTVRNLATILEVLIRDTQQHLKTLVQLPQVQRLDRDACNALLAKLLEESPHYAVLGGADPEGRVFASAPAARGPVNVADRLWFRKVFQTRTFFVGEPLLGRVSGKYSFNMSYPIQDDLGRFQGAVVIAVDLNWLGGLLARSDLPASAALVLTDGTRKVLFRHPEPLKYIGKMLPDILIKAMTTGDEGVAEGLGLPGDERLFAFVRLSPPWQDMCLAIGLPRDPALAKVNRDLQRNLLWLGLVGLLAMTAAWYGSGVFIVWPVRRLRSVIERLAEGDLTGRAGPDYTAGELGYLAHAFDQMADSIQERDARLKEAARELAQRVRDLNLRTAQLEEANKELEAFSYSVSHDLRAPLRGIAGFSRILLEDYAGRLDADGKRFLNIIQSDTQKMGKLIDDLLALSRFGRREMRFGAFQMEGLVRAVSKDLRELDPGRNLEIQIKPMPTAQGDRDMVRQVLMNLLANAIKFTRTRETAEIEVSGWNTETENVYCVRDNGVGFEMEYGDKLFGVFQRLHSEDQFEGTGVGLAIVQRIIQRHGGRVWAEATVGAGATFYFTLPKENLEAKTD
jgi:signal transduction histidine kinase